MSDIIITSQVNCRYCYKCLRNCPIKSIEFKDGKSFILNQDCILCGNCIEVCPQKARSYISEIDRFKNLINKPFLVSIAPSFFAHFDEPLKVISILKSLGGIAIQETAVGADIVSFSYKKLMTKSNKTVMTTACPVIVELAEHYFPEVLEYLAPFLSPMNAHSIYMKQLFGDFPIVYIGPCIAKKKEGIGYIDLVLTYKELEVFLKEKGIKVEEFEESFPTPPYPDRGRIYPISGGINATLDGNWTRHLVVEGIENIINIFRNLVFMEEGFFIEASSCFGGCINSLGIRNDISYLEKRNRILRFTKRLKEINGENINPNLIKIDITRRFNSKKKELLIKEEDIKEVLKSIGKDSPEKELNCSACGYSSCREKAIAVLQGKAEREMCLTYMIDRATSVSNVIIDNFPNIFIIYKDKKVIYVNPSGKAFLKDREDLITKIILEIENNNETSLELAIDNKKYFFFVKTFELPQDNGKVAMLIDITQEKLQREQIEALKRETIENMEKVINKQMLLAQEIASLLGESIAETKSHFIEFKRFIEGEQDANL